MFKQLKFLAPFMMLLLLVSCSKDDKNSDKIIGTWELESFTQEGESIINIPGLENINSSIKSYSKNENFKIIFDESTLTSQGGYTIVTETISNGEVYNEETDISNEKETVAYKLEGNKIISDQSTVVDQSEYPDTANEEDIDIKYEISGDKLRIYQEVNLEQDSEAGKIKMDFATNLIFKKK